MTTLTVFQVDAFTTQKFKGNPAGVVLDADGLTTDQMQMIARELNNSETAFVLSPCGDDHEVWLRYFTPTTEVPLCGHATIAAHFIRACELQLDSCAYTHKTGAGILPIQIERQTEGYQVIMTQARPGIQPALSPDLKIRVLNALGLKPGDLNPACPVQVVSAGHSKVFIGIQSRQVLNRLHPDLNALISLSQKINCNGYFVFTFDSSDPGILTCARMFAPAIGINEDPVTGNGNGPLGAYLIHNRLVEHNGRLFEFKGRQGEAIKRTGTVDVQVDIEDNRPVRTRVGGPAVMVFKTEITI